MTPALGAKAYDVKYAGHFLVFAHLALRRKTLQVFIRWITRELKFPMEPMLTAEWTLPAAPRRLD